MISEEKISGFTDPVSLKRIRAEFAAVLNRECRREGLDVRFTHQNYKERGIDANRQEHYGPERTALHRNGKAVNMVARNQARVERNETKAALSVVNIAAEATTKFEELVRWRLALLDRRKILRRRMKVIDGVLTLVDEVSVASGIGSQHRPATLESISVKRLAVTNVAQRFDRLDAGNGANHQRRDDARHATLKGPVLAKIDKHFATLLTKASSPHYTLQRRQAGPVGQGTKRRAVLVKLLAMMDRQATVAVWRASAVAIRDSAGRLFHETASVGRETSLNASKAVDVVGVTPASTNLVGANQARSDTPISASVAEENAAVSATTDTPNNRLSIDQGGDDQPAKELSIIGTQAGNKPTVLTENSTVETSVKIPTPAGNDPSTTGHEKQRPATKPGRDDTSSSEALGTPVPIGKARSLPHEPMTKEEIRDLLKPRRVGPDGIFKIVDLAVATSEEDSATGSKSATTAESVDGRFGSDEQISSKLGDSAPARSTTTVLPEDNAPAPLPVDQHDRLIAQFETARCDDERRLAAAAVRKDKIALARMVERVSPQWIATDNQCRAQQGLAEPLGKGIGG